MDRSPHALSFDDVIELCGSVATSRGQVYKASGRVVALDWNAERSTLDASVQGGAAEPYRQRIAIAPHRLESECTCPVRRDCKHVAAALLVWIERQHATPSADDGTLRAVNRWLQRLVEHGRRRGGLEHHELGEPLLFYQLDAVPLSQRRRGVTLSILQSRLLKRGGFGKESPYRYHGHYHHPEWVVPSDRAILDLAVGRHGELGYRPLVVEGDIGHLLMEKLVATGRAWWGPSRERPLALGTPRALRFDWRDDGGGRLVLDTSVEGSADWRLVPAEPPWYVDVETAEAAPLEGAPPAALLGELVDAPPLPEEHAQAVSNYLGSRLPDVALPLPRTPNFVRVDEPPRPVLVLHSREDSADIRDFFASIRFRYGEYLLPFDGLDADATLEGRTAGGEPLVLERDLAAEMEHVTDFTRRHPDFEPALTSDPGYFSRADRKPRAREPQELARVWRELLERRGELEAAGWRVEVREPFDLSFRAVTRVEARVAETTSSWFDMALQLSDGEQRFDLLPLVIEWLESERQDRPILVQASDGQWLEIAPELFEPVARTLLELHEDAARATPDGTRLRLPRQRAGALDELDAAWRRHGLGVRWREADGAFALAERLRGFAGLERPPVPPEVRATLRPYQLDGVAWLGFLAEYGFNGILADDMGLGKTLQALVHVAIERAAGRLSRPTLIVAPTSLLGNWQREIERFTPHLSSHVWHGTDRRSRLAALGEVELVVTSYALVTRDIELLVARDFGLVVLDEAQAIKNPSAKVTQALKRLPVARRLCLTGTPLENHLGELWSQFDFLMPGFLGTRKHFVRHFRTPIETHGSEARRERLAALIRPFLLRRRKEDVATELPPKTEIVREVDLEPAQARLYESIRVSMERRVRTLLAERGLAGSHVEMLDALLKLRQTCCHPALVKLESARGVTASAKTDLVLDMLDELVDEGKKILLFSQFTEMLALLEREIGRRGIRYVKLTGRTRRREQVIDAFQHGDVPLFLISLKAGGTGLNLTAADTVIHYDPWWNPAVETQASDRAHRIGQTKPVFIYKLVASDTVEEKITALQERKQRLVDGTVERGAEGALAGLTAEDVLELFAPIEDRRSSAA